MGFGRPGYVVTFGCSCDAVSFHGQTPNMSFVDTKPSKIACGGILAGMLLLGIAGTMVVMSSSPYLSPLTVEEHSRRLTGLLAGETDAGQERMQRTGMC